MRLSLQCQCTPQESCGNTCCWGASKWKRFLQYIGIWQDRANCSTLNSQFSFRLSNRDLMVSVVDTTIVWKCVSWKGGTALVKRLLEWNRTFRSMSMCLNQGSSKRCHRILLGGKRQLGALPRHFGLAKCKQLAKKERKKRFRVEEKIARDFWWNANSLYLVCM